MKRVIIVLALICLMTGLVFSANNVATIFKNSGEVLIKRAGEAEYDLHARILMELAEGDALQTGADGMAVLMFSVDKSEIKIRKNSSIELSQDYDIRTIKMTEGRVFVDVTKGTKNTYRIETPTSVASVKGTRFWVISSGQFGDRFYGIDGQVEIFNLQSGLESILLANQMIISTNDGQLLNIPVEPSDIPSGDDSDSGSGPQKTGDEDSGTQSAQQAPPSAIQASPSPQESAETGPEPQTARSSPYGLGLGLGSVTIDGKIYNQMALRPEARFGKLGIGLDLIFYFDEKGKIRKNEWDQFSDYLDKIYYIRWAQQGDPFFLRVGALDNVTLGYGILMHGYSNTTEYPQVRKIGVHTGMQFEKLGWEAMTANTKELSGPGVIGGRLTYRMSQAFPLTFGATVVSDVNQYVGMRDTDEDYIPDVFDAFPEEDFKLPQVYPVGAFGFNPGDKLSGKDYLKDSDRDGIPDELDYDVDGDGLTDNYQPDPTRNFDDDQTVSPDPFNIKDQRKALTGISFDLGYPIFSNKLISLYAYGQAATFLAKDVTDYYSKETFTPGWGLAVPGVKASILSFINVNVEYRHADKNFLYNYWDRAYDYERVSIRTDSLGIWPYTKDEIKMRNDAMNGVFGSLDINILDYIILGTYYQHMTSGDQQIKSFMASASIPKGRIPKVAQAVAFYQRNNDENPFRFKKPSEDTILGYRLGFDIGGGAVLSLVYQITYRDFDGNGSIDPKNEAIKLTTIETGFNF